MPRSPYARGSVDYPSVVIVLLWVGLWLLWPQIKGSPAAAAKLPRPRVWCSNFGSEEGFVHKNPTLFARTSPFGFGMPDTAVTNSVLRPEAVIHRARYLDRPIAHIEAPLRRFIGPGVCPPLDVQRYSPAWARQAAFPAATNSAVRLRVVASAPLAARGFAAPPALDQAARRLDPPWTVRVSVDVGPDGQIEHVFLESGSGNRDVDGGIVRALYEATVRATGERSAGRVEIDCVRM